MFEVMMYCENGFEISIFEGTEEECQDFFFRNQGYYDEERLRWDYYVRRKEN